MIERREEEEGESSAAPPRGERKEGGKIKRSARGGGGTTPPILFFDSGALPNSSTEAIKKGVAIRRITVREAVHSDATAAANASASGNWGRDHFYCRYLIVTTVIFNGPQVSRKLLVECCNNTAVS